MFEPKYNNDIVLLDIFIVNQIKTNEDDKINRNFLHLYVD